MALSPYDIAVGHSLAGSFIAYEAKPSLNAHDDLSSWATGQQFGPSLYLYPYFVYMSREGSVA